MHAKLDFSKIQTQKNMRQFQSTRLDKSKRAGVGLVQERKMEVIKQTQ